MADLGRFSTTKQWFEGKGDPFGRTPAILTYDREANRIVTADPRVWISGMSDEGGAGSWVAAVMKQLDNPNAAEIARIEELVDKTVVGRLQVADGPHAGGVKKSLFYYDPVAFPTSTNPPRIGRAGPRGRRARPTIWAVRIIIRMSQPGIGCSTGSPATIPA